MGPRNRLGLQNSSKIVYTDKDGREISYPIIKEITTIGKQADQDIQLSDPYVSRHHACLVVKGKELWIVDKGSTNGVFLITTGTQSAWEPDDTPKLLRWNDVCEVKGEERLQDGYIILLGDTELHVLMDEHSGKS